MINSKKNYTDKNCKTVSHKKALFSLLATCVASIALYSSEVVSQDSANPFKGRNTTILTKQREAFDAWMLRAYEGDRDAQFKIALMFSDGTGTGKDIEQAVYWYIQAARQGLASAQYNLGHKYLNGEGTSKDPAKAVNWWRKAAEQDHELAQFNVARAYYSGIGVNQDETRAKYWFKRAAANDEPRSQKILADVFNVPQNEIGATVTTVEPSFGSITNEATTTTIQSSYIENTDTETINYPSNPTVISMSESETYTLPVETPAAQIDQAEPVNYDTNTATAITTTTATGSPLNFDTNDEINDELSTINEIIIYNKPNSSSSVITRELSSNLDVVKQTQQWAQVRSSQGLPVWIYKTFTKISDGVATITGDNVNARATPLVLRGSVVGQFFKNQTAPVLEEREKWVKVQAPTRFTAWVKRSELSTGQNTRYAASQAPKAVEIVTKNLKPATKINDIVASKTTLDSDLSSRKKPQKIKVTDTYAFKNKTNDNDWLFSLPHDSYTLQLASFSDDAVLNRFIKQKNLQSDGNLRQFISNRNNIEWKYLLYGNYNSIEEAEAAKTNKKFKKSWVRKAGLIRKNRCVAWKTTLPTPPELKVFCQ